MGNRLKQSKFPLQRDSEVVYGALTECSVDPVAQAKHPPIDLKRLVVNIVMIPLREHVNKYHKNRVSKSQYREINVCGAFDACSGEFRI
jgi:hypothetical protein